MTNNMIKLSIIIPVYGVEKYVGKCLESVFNQNTPTTNYEIIIINDGTKDNSWNIVKDKIKGENNVKLIVQSNQGLSAARNNGLKIAEGKFIWFVDSDDWIESNCLSDIISTLDSNTDVLSFTRMIPEGDWKGKPYFIPDNVTTKVDYFKCNSPSPVQFYIYRRDFLVQNHLQFKVGIKHEDSLFTPWAIIKAQKLQFYRKPVYHFLKRCGSITTTVDNSRISSYGVVIIQNYSLYESLNDVKLKHALANKIADSIIAQLDMAFKCDDDLMKDKVINFYHEHAELLLLLKYSVKPRIRMISYLAKMFPKSFVVNYFRICKIINR